MYKDVYVNRMDCPICWCTYKNSFEGSCGHNVCLTCRQQMIRYGYDTCPMCRADWPLPVEHPRSKVQMALDTHWLMGDPSCGIKIRWRVKRHSKRMRRLTGY